MRIVEPEDIGSDPTLKPLADVGTTSVTVKGTSAQAAAELQCPRCHSVFVRGAQRQPEQQPYVDHQGARERGYYAG